MKCRAATSEYIIIYKIRSIAHYFPPKHILKSYSPPYQNYSLNLFCLSTHDALDSGENNVQDYKKSLYIQQYFEFIVRKLEIQPVSSFFLYISQVHPNCLKKTIFNTLLHFSDREVCNFDGSQGVTTATCKHVTSFIIIYFLWNAHREPQLSLCVL